MEAADPLQPVLQKLKQYCAYSERCHADVVGKLYDLKVWQKDHDAVIAALIEENYLNEERYAKAFVRGHFEQKKWGRNKIKYELQVKKISPYCIKSGMKEIDEALYEQTLQALFESKWQSLSKEKNRFVKMRKASDYLQQKGFETSLINELFKTV